MGALERDFGLTKREIEISANIFNGLKNAEIAEKLFISEITVKKHLQHIFEKIGVSSRTALIRKALEYQSQTSRVKPTVTMRGRSKQICSLFPPKAEILQHGFSENTPGSRELT